MKIKKGDKVIVITGKEKGKSAPVVRAFPKDSMVLLEGLNMRKKHQKPRKQGEKGKVIEVAYPMHVSNVKKI
ncbi:MAG: 50S ribosomal protein L24 [Patescibacteria group bacterium]